MKKVTTDPRKDWKNDIEEEVITLLENIDELQLPEETQKAIEKLIDTLKLGLSTTVDMLEVTPEIALKDRDFIDEMIERIYMENVNLSESAADRMVDILTINEGRGQFVKLDSLAQEIRLEAFLSEMAQNPYQLKLIA